MIASNRLIYGLFLVVCVGCGAGTSYQRGSWIHSNSESDWDIDSAVCLGQSDTVTEEDERAIKSIKERARDLKSAATTITRSVDQTISREADLALVVLSGLISFRGNFDEQTADEKVRENKFSSCMAEKGWEHPDP